MKFLSIIAALFLTTACSIGIDPIDLREAADQPQGIAQKLADSVLVVSGEHRSLRVCMFTAMAVEIMTDHARLYDPTRATNVLGRLVALQSAVDASRDAGTLWVNANMANITFMFTEVLLATGEERVIDYLKGGISIDNVLGAASRLATTTAKGSAMLRDIDAMFISLRESALTEDQLWTACIERANKNKRTLQVLTG